MDGALIREIGVGIGILAAGIGALVVCIAMARTFARLNRTLDEVDRQIAALSAPVTETLKHVGGIAETADVTVARLTTVVGALEKIADGVGDTAKLASDAVAPALVNVGATLTGVTAGLKRLVIGDRSSSHRASPDSEPEPEGVMSA